MTEDYPTKQHLLEWGNYSQILLFKISSEQDKIKKEYYQNRLKSVKRLLELKK